MYRSYTQFFRIFGAVIIFLQISKVAALFKIQKILKPHCSLPLLSLTAWTRSSATQIQDTAVSSALAGQTRRRHGSGEANRTCMTYTTSQIYPNPQYSSRLTGGSSTPAMAARARRRTAQP